MNRYSPYNSIYIFDVLIYFLTTKQKTTPLMELSVLAVSQKHWEEQKWSWLYLWNGLYCMYQLLFGIIVIFFSIFMTPSASVLSSFTFYTCGKQNRKRLSNLLQERGRARMPVTAVDSRIYVSYQCLVLHKPRFIKGGQGRPLRHGDSWAKAWRK